MPKSEYDLQRLVPGALLTVEGMVAEVAAVLGRLRQLLTQPGPQPPAPDLARLYLALVEMNGKLSVESARLAQRVTQSPTASVGDAAAEADPAPDSNGEVTP